MNKWSERLRESQEWMEVKEIKRRVNFDNKVVVNNKNSGRRLIRLELKNSS